MRIWRFKVPVVVVSPLEGGVVVAYLLGVPVDGVPALLGGDGP